MPGRGARPASTNGSKKRAAADDDSSSPRRSKRTRQSANAASLADPDTSETDEPKKLTKRVTTAKGTASVGGNKSQTRTTETEVKVEQEETTRATEDTGDAVKKEIKIEGEGIQPKKATKKRASKEEKATEMEPLVARTKGLQMFVGAHVSAAKGSLIREIPLLNW